MLLRLAEVMVERRLSVNVYQGDLFKLPWRDASFDLVFNEGVVEHWTGEKRVECIRQMARLSRDCVAIVTNDAEGERSKKRAEGTVHSYVGMPEKEVPYTMEELAANMRLAGLSKVEVYKVDQEETQEYLLGVGFKPRV